MNKEDINKEMQIDNKEEKKKGGLSMPVISIIIAGVIILSAIIYHTFTPSQSNSIGDLDNELSDPYSLVVDEDTIPELELTEELHEERQSDDSSINIDDPIFLIVGSFSLKEGALKTAKIYHDLGFQPIVEDLDGNGLNKILIKSFTDKELSQALKMRKELMKKYPKLMKGVWIYNRGITKQATKIKLKKKTERRPTREEKKETERKVDDKLVIEGRIKNKIDLNDNIFILGGSYDNITTTHKAVAKLKAKGLDPMAITIGAEQKNRVLIKTYSTISEAEKDSIILLNRYPELAPKLEIWDKHKVN